MEANLIQKLKEIQRELRTLYPECQMVVQINSCELLDEEKKTFDKKFIADFGLHRYEKAGNLENGELEISESYEREIYTHWGDGLRVVLKTQEVRTIKKAKIIFS